jgi:hypothetical protein
MSLSALSKKSTLVIFAYSPTGLGHLRVTDALYHGLPEDVTPILLGSQDKTISALHRFMSIHPLTRALFEWGQRGFIQYVVTFLYHFFLHNRTKLLYQQLVTILDERLDVPETLVVVATHFGLAHQLAHVKETVMNEKNIKMLLFLQVTDDSPQPIWYVPGADMTFVPSNYTKNKLDAFCNMFRLPHTPMKVTPYPVAPSFSQRLSPDHHQKRIDQVSLDSKSYIHVSLPVPGAAVGTDFLYKLIHALHKKSDRFIFHVIAKQAQYTKSFLSEMVEIPYVKLHVSTHDRETVNNYEKLFDEYVISLEITKPSEQTFKALLNPSQKGGVVLLFAHPVGRQEYDNIAFLRRHHLIPTQAVQQMLWEKAEKQKSLDDVMGKEILKVAKTWRGLLLPQHSLQSTDFIVWCIKNEIFTHMMHYSPQTHTDDPHKEELGDDGVQQFWRQVSEMVENRL